MFHGTIDGKIHFDNPTKTASLATGRASFSFHHSLFRVVTSSMHPSHTEWHETSIVYRTFSSHLKANLSEPWSQKRWPPTWPCKNISAKKLWGPTIRNHTRREWPGFRNRVIPFIHSQRRPHLTTAISRSAPLVFGSHFRSDRCAERASVSEKRILRLDSGHSIPITLGTRDLDNFCPICHRKKERWRRRKSDKNIG